MHFFTNALGRRRRAIASLRALRFALTTGAAAALWLAAPGCAPSPTTIGDALSESECVRQTPLMQGFVCKGGGEAMYACAHAVDPIAGCTPSGVAFDTYCCQVPDVCHDALTPVIERLQTCHSPFTHALESEANESADIPCPAGAEARARCQASCVDERTCAEFDSCLRFCQ